MCCSCCSPSSQIFLQCVKTRLITTATSRSMCGATRRPKYSEISSKERHNNFKWLTATECHNVLFRVFYLYFYCLWQPCAMLPIQPPSDQTTLCSLVYSLQTHWWKRSRFVFSLFVRSLLKTRFTLMDTWLLKPSVKEKWAMKFRVFNGLFPEIVGIRHRANAFYTEMKWVEVMETIKLVLLCSLVQLSH